MRLGIVTNGINFRPLCPELAAKELKHVYRTGSLSWLTAEEAYYLRSVCGIQVFVDLRSPLEVEQTGAPNALLEQNVQWLQGPKVECPSSILASPIPTSSDYAEYYLWMVEQGRDTWKSIVDLVMDNINFPLAFGCFLGKDRTGVLAAILLDKFGASDEMIAHDFAQSGQYLLRSRHLFREKWIAKGLSEDVYLSRIQTSPETMLYFLSQMRARHGGLWKFLSD